MIDNIALFVAVAKAGSLKLAAESLDMPPSTLSRRIKALEKELGCLLLNRNSHRFKLTNEGQKLFDSASFHVESLRSIVNEIRNDVSGQQGSIRVLAPTNLTKNHFQTVFAQYLRQNPAVDLQLELSNSLVNFASAGADFAIRVGPQADSELSQVKLGSLKTRLIASRAYFADRHQPLTPGELEQHNLIVAKPLSVWTFNHRHNQADTVAVTANRQRLVVNDLDVAKQFALDGLGIALLPETFVEKEIGRGDLIPVLPAWEGNRRDVYAIWYRRQLLTRRASDLIDHLKLHSGLA